MWGLIIAIALIVISFLLMPKPKQAPDTSTDTIDPTASAGIPIPQMFGTILVKNPNILWFGDKHHEQYEVSPE